MNIREIYKDIPGADCNKAAEDIVEDICLKW